MKKLVDKLTYIEEDPQGPLSRLNRRWKRVPIFSIRNHSVVVGLEHHLVQYEGKPWGPRPANHWLLYLYWTPEKWVKAEQHIYYDGPHCFYQYGPFAYARRDGKGCKKCQEEI